MKKLFTLFSLMLFYISGMLAANIANNTVIYFDATAYTDIQQSIASGKKLQMLLGHGSWSQGYQLTAVEGYENLYSVKMPNWDGCTQLAFMTVDSQWGGEGSSVSSRVQWGYTKTPVYSITSNMSGNVGYAGNPLARTDNYTLPVKAPKITVAAAPQFATTTVGETSSATLKYTLENATEATATIEGEGFSISAQEVGSVTIAFAPEAEGDYTGTLTITSGEVKETVALAAKAVAAEAPKVPEFLNVTTPVFAEIIEGEVTTAEVTYELVNATEATASVDGEFFSIKEQELGKVIIEFASEEAGVFEGTLTLTSGETVKEITFTATAKKAPVIVTISFVNPDWTEAAIWAWVEGGENLTGGTWPGEAMTKDETTGVFSYALTIPEDGVYSFIINNNNNGLQSVDMTGVTESTCYNLGAKSGEKYNLVVAENCDYTPAPEPEPIDPYVAIRGTMTDWVMENDIKMTYNADAANGPEWYITAFEVPADGKFKVVSVDAQSQATWYGSDKVDLQEGITNAGEGDADIALPAGKYDIYFKVNEGRMWIQKYVETPEPEPTPVVITFVDEVTFPKTFVGETTNDIIEFTLENAEEDAEVVVEVTGEAFSVAEVQDNFIFLAFAPETEGEYAGVLTVTVGEVSESLEFTAVASPVEPDPEPAELEFALVGRLNGDNDNEILAFEDGYKFTQESEFVYTLNITFTGTIEASGKQVQKVKLVDAEGNIWARNSSKTIKPGDGTSTMTKGETASSTYLQCEAGVEYKITYTLVSDPAEALYKLSGQITFEEVQAEEPEPVDPVINVIVADFTNNTTEVGDQADATIIFSLENAESADVTVECEYTTFQVQDVDEGYAIGIIFTPEEAGEFPGKVIITAGEVTEEIEFTFIATEADPEPDPEPAETITFTVQVPEGTIECWVTGSPLWEEGEFLPMERVEGEENMFTVTTTLAVLDGKAWKYCSGEGWEYVEKTTEGGDVDNRTVAGNPDVVAKWGKIYDPDFEPIEPYYAIRGLNGDALWTGDGDIKLKESEDGLEWSATGFTVSAGESFKVIYIDENNDVTGWYGSIEAGCEVGQSYDKDGNIVLPEGKYDLYFKIESKYMWIAKNDTPTDVEDAVAELIYAIDGTIYAPAPFAIIDLAGKDVTNANGDLEGAYIVKTQNSVTKVLVK